MSKRVVVVAPPCPLKEVPAPPLGVTYVAAAFERAGADVRIIDYVVNGYTAQKLHRQLDEIKPDILGATSVTFNFHIAAKIVCEAKRHDPDILTMMGGPHVSFTSEDVLKRYPEIDLIVVGEGEETIAELMAAGCDPEKFHGIPGIVFRNNGRIIRNIPRGYIQDLDTLPLPARHLLQMSRYQALGFPISIITSRGCPYSCIFCLGRRMVGKRIRRRSPIRVVDEIEEILGYGISRINVADDIFVSKDGNVSEICNEILRRGLRFAWSAFARVDTVDPATLKLMKEAGCDSISFGVESGNRQILKMVRKGITLDQVRNAVSLCKQTGIIAHVSFIVGLPGETENTLNDTAEFADSLGCHYGYHFLSPFPGTKIREDIDRYDLKIVTNDWTRYDANSAIVSTSSLSPETMDRFVDDFERNIEEAWLKMVRGYHEKTNPPEIDMQVEGNLRMKLVYRLLTEDLIEKYGEIFDISPVDSSNVLQEELCRRLEEATGYDFELIQRTIRIFTDSGYISPLIDGCKCRWRWTHNIHMECLPGKRESITVSFENPY